MSGINYFRTITLISQLCTRNYTLVHFEILYGTFDQHTDFSISSKFPPCGILTSID